MLAGAACNQPDTACHAGMARLTLVKEVRDNDYQNDLEPVIIAIHAVQLERWPNLVAFLIVGHQPQLVSHWQGLVGWLGLLPHLQSHHRQSGSEQHHVTDTVKDKDAILCHTSVAKGQLVDHMLLPQDRGLRVCQPKLVMIEPRGH